MAVRWDARKRPVTPAKTFIPVPFSRIPMLVNSTSKHGLAGSRCPGLLILGLASICASDAASAWGSAVWSPEEGGAGPPKAAHTGTWAEPCFVGLCLFGFLGLMLRHDQAEPQNLACAVRLDMVTWSRATDSSSWSLLMCRWIHFTVSDKKVYTPCGHIQTHLNQHIQCTRNQTDASLLY